VSIRAPIGASLEQWIEGVRFRQFARRRGNGFFDRGFVSLLVMDETQRAGSESPP